MKERVKRAWRTAVDMKDLLMVRVWALGNVKAYRHKALKIITVALAALMFVGDTATHGWKLSLFGILMLVMTVALIGCYISEAGKEAANEKNS